MVPIDVTHLPNPSSAGKTIRAELKCPCKSKKGGCRRSTKYQIVVPTPS